jgi:YrbI family 3-deoxy-D-manno-octulosonate 8-phosphate phosphatase
MNIKLVIFDFDGVFSNGRCYFDLNHSVSKYYNIKDGMAVGLLKKNNIKTGLISSYNTNKRIFLIETEEDCGRVDKEIINHLKFDYEYIGKENKLTILQNWMTELNITFNEIAYIGDDVNDIEILEKVGFSACPSDAVEECREIVDYICRNKGGEGCVREFVNKILHENSIASRNIIDEMKKEAIYQLNNLNSNLDEINKIAQLISNCSCNIYMTGIGKSENIANHFCNLLKSISISCFNLNAINALHGDVGTIKENDLIFLFSKSGNTSELIQLIPFLRERKCYTIGICCDDDSRFLSLCHRTFKLPFNKEIGGGELNKIPTNSYMSQLFFSNIIVSILKNKININQYKSNHPAGNIGNELKKIKDCILIEKYPKIILDNEIKLHDILLEMTKFKIGCSFFVNQTSHLIGILTDGDIRRLLLEDENKKIININDINKNYYYETDLDKFIYECKKSNYIPILNNSNNLIGIINNACS